jgi:hypothetical protein
MKFAGTRRGPRVIITGRNGIQQRISASWELRYNRDTIID